MKQRLPILLSAAALVVAVLGASSLGEATTNAVKNTATALKQGASPVNRKAQNASSPRRGPRGRRGRRGSAGPPGPVGPQGPAGPQGIQSLTKVSNSMVVPPLSYRTITAQCPAGQKAVSGGFIYPYEIWESQASLDRLGWTVTGANLSSTYSLTLFAYAYCSANITTLGSPASPGGAELRSREMIRRMSDLAHR